MSRWRIGGLVGGVEGGEQVRQQSPDGRLRDLGREGHHVLEAPRREVLHHHEGVVAFDGPVVDARDAIVLHGEQRGELALEQIDRALAPRGAEDLDRHPLGRDVVAPGVGIQAAGEEDRSEAPLAELLHQSVAEAAL